MDDNPEKPEQPKRRSRSTLVERAAEKLVESTRASQGARESAPAVQSQPAPKLELENAVQPTVSPGGARFEEEALQAAVLAGTPQAFEQPAMAAKPAQQPRSSAVVQIDIADLARRGIVTPTTKRNRTVEEFRLIKRMVLNRRWDEGDAPGNTIVVTSALPSEGKTTTAINLAMSIAAEEDLRVLLVDADFIKPDALRQLGVSARKGLIDVLQDPNMDIADVMLRTNIDKLSLIPSGQLHDRCTELLASARMDELITELAHRYPDRILIFDSPPLLVTTESVALASHMGQIVFVVQAGRTKRESVLSALELLGDRPQLGLVLNRTTARFGNVEFGAYYGSYSGYGYRYGREREVEEAERAEA